MVYPPSPPKREESQTDHGGLEAFVHGWFVLHGKAKVAFGHGAAHGWRALIPVEFSEGTDLCQSFFRCFSVFLSGSLGLHIVDLQASLSHHLRRRVGKAPSPCYGPGLDGISDPAARTMPLHAVSFRAQLCVLEFGSFCLGIRSCSPPLPASLSCALPFPSTFLLSSSYKRSGSKGGTPPSFHASFFVCDTPWLFLCGHLLHPLIVQTWSGSTSPSLGTGQGLGLPSGWVEFLLARFVSGSLDTFPFLREGRKIHPFRSHGTFPSIPDLARFEPGCAKDGPIPMDHWLVWTLVLGTCFTASRRAIGTRPCAPSPPKRPRVPCVFGRGPSGKIEDTKHNAWASVGCTPTPSREGRWHGGWPAPPWP